VGSSYGIEIKTVNRQKVMKLFKPQNMIKKLILIISVLFLGAESSFSQQQYITPMYVSMDKFQVLDSAYMKCTFRLTHVIDTLKAEKTRETDMQTLLIGKKMSKYFSQYMVDYCSYAKLNMKDGLCPNNTERGSYGYEIFKNYPDNKMTVTDLGSQVGDPFGGGNFKYEDELNNQKWEIKSDTSTVLSYPCQKAITTFRGRTYEAWFTTDIPINNGPWKFGGLPGLILKISDQKQYFVFECIGIEKLRKMESIKYYDLKYAKLSRIALGKLYQRKHDDFVAYDIANGSKIKTVVYSNTGEAKELTHWPKQPYNPIEKE
jgi:GLPGLI family protein